MNEIFLLDNEDYRKKTKEELENNWKEFEQEQTRLFEELIKRQKDDRSCKEFN